MTNPIDAGIEEKIEITGTLHDGGGVVSTSSSECFVTIDYVKQIDKTLTFKLMLYQPKLKALLLQTLEEVIGADEKLSAPTNVCLDCGVDEVYTRNQLRAEAREKLKEILGDK